MLAPAFSFMPRFSPARRWIAIGALVGALGVGFGALGAHGLAGYLQGLGYSGDDLARRLDIFDTAVHYQMLHAIALVLTGLALERQASRPWRFYDTASPFVSRR